MDERLRNLAEGCVEIHKTQGDTKEIRKHFRLNVQKAYDLGREDATKEGVKTAPLRRDDASATTPSSEPPAADTNPTIGHAQVTEQPGEAHAKGKGKHQQKSQPVTDAAAAAKKVADSF